MRNFEKLANKGRALVHERAARDINLKELNALHEIAMRGNLLEALARSYYAGLAEGGRAVKRANKERTH